MERNNPYESGSSPDSNDPSGTGSHVSTQRAAYNVVTDVVVGPNVRWKDNLFQALAILLSAIVGAGIGYFVADDKPLGVIAGAGAGLLVGLFGSGIFLMVWRATRHLRGKHD